MLGRSIISIASPVSNKDVPSEASISLILNIAAGIQVSDEITATVILTVSSGFMGTFIINIPVIIVRTNKPESKIISAGFSKNTIMLQTNIQK